VQEVPSNSQLPLLLALIEKDAGSEIKDATRSLSVPKSWHTLRPVLKKTGTENLITVKTG